MPLSVTAILSALGTVLVTWPLVLDMGSATLRSGEVLLTAWQLNWYQQALLTNPPSWVDANIFFPYDKTATFNDLLITHALITLPAAWDSSPVLALNLALLGGIVLCGVCAHLLIDEVVEQPWVAVTAATLFALSPFRFIHLGHLAIAAAWSIPLFFWTLLRHLRQPSWPRAAAAALCGVTVGLSSLYNAAYVAPLVPLVLVIGVRRGPGGRKVWWPLMAAAVPAGALLAAFLLPFAATLQGFGVAAAPDDLLRYGADITSLGQRLDYRARAPEITGIDPEAHLYPGLALLLLAVAGAAVEVRSMGRLPGSRRGAALTFVGLVAAIMVGFLLPLSGSLRAVWAAGLLALIWIGPIALASWAVAGTSKAAPSGSDLAIRLGLAGAALSFVLALGPQARYLTAVIGPAPYWLLTQVSAAFAGTRVPARFGGLVLLFLAVLGAGALAAFRRNATRASRLVGSGVACTAIILCFAELPLPAWPKGNDLVPLPSLRDPAYRWISEQPGRFGILELPDWSPTANVHWRLREWRSLRHMLASKQHGQHLVNGSGRIEPFLWRRFGGLAPWSDEFYTYINAYFPVRYVLVHENAVPPDSHALWARLDLGTDGWRQVFRSSRIRVYEIDRSFARGPTVDRLLLRRDLAPAATVVFDARLAAAGPGTLDLLRDQRIITSWPIDGEWRSFRATVAIPPILPEGASEWPRTGALLRWQVRGEAATVIELRKLSVERVEPPH